VRKLQLSYRAIDIAIGFAFVAGAVLATVPIWRIYAFGFNPSLDVALQLSICGGKLNP
jgi:hypothetical protein